MSRLDKESPFNSVASTSQEGQGEEPCLSHNGRLRVTLLSSEWKSTKGGLSTIIRELAIQLAKHPNVEVSVYLPQCSEEDRKVASDQNVQLIKAEELPGFDPTDWLSSLPKDHRLHCVIGHGVHLGRQIPLIKRLHDCKWIQVVHTAPEELGMFKSYEEAISKGEEKHQAEVKLCERADQVVAFGPKLKDAYSRYLRFSGKDQDVLDLTPGIFSEFYSVKQATEERSKFSILVFGCGDNEDFKLKGYDIAAQAIAELKDTSYQLIFVGAPAGKEDDLAKRLLHHGIPANQLTVRRFNESREQLAKLFCEVDLAIMPSRTEGFGLTALEALSAGLPVLVSSNSGLGDSLKKVPSGSYCVIDSEDPKEWAKAIKCVRKKEREVRLEEVKFLRDKYAVKYSWQEQCDFLVEKMLHLTFGSLCTWQPSAVNVSPSLSTSVYSGPEEPTGEASYQEVSNVHDFCIKTDVGSLKDRGSTEKGRRWFSLADPSGTPSYRHLKGSDLRRFCKLLRDEYNRRSKLKPLLWNSTFHLPLDKVYTRLEVKWRKQGTFQLTDKEGHMYEIFNLGKRDKKAGWFQKLRFMFKKGTQEKARMVLVEGSPGIGKTTFCLKLANDWAKKAIPTMHDFPVFKLILLLKCRDMDGNVVQAIDDQLLPEDMTEKEKKDLMDYIRDEQNQDKILIILDGLDELPQSAEQSLDKFLRRKVMPHCSVLATLRQEKGIEIRQLYDFDSLLQVNGFTIKDASEYIRRHFKNVDSEDLLKGERLIRDIKENIFLHALRNNPLNLLLLCVVFEEFEGDLPSNRSELYQIICQCLLRRFCSKNNLEVQRGERALENQFETSTLVLGGLAWKCLLEDRPCFLEEELDKLEKSITNGKGFSVVKLGFVFMEASFKKLNPRHEYHFVHRTFQEYLAAAYLALKILKDEINVFDDFQLGKRDITRKYRQVFLFVAGILGKDGTMFFKQVGELLNRNWNWKSPDEEDCKFLTELLTESRAADELARVVWPCIPLPKSLELSLRDRRTLRIMRYAHEASSPVNLANLTLTEAHYLTEDSASDVQCILNNEAMKDLFVSTDEMTNLLSSTLLKGFSASNLFLSSVTLKVADIAVDSRRSLSRNSRTTVTFRLIKENYDDTEGSERKETLMRKGEIDIFCNLHLHKRDVTRKYRKVFMFVAGVLGKDGAMFFKWVGQLLIKNWNWQFPAEQEDGVFLTELLNASGVADELAKVVWPCIPLPQSLALSLRDKHTLRFVRYAHEASSLEKNLTPVNLTQLTLTEAHTLTEDRASDVQCILNNKALKHLSICTDKMTSLLTSTLLKGLSASNLSLSSVSLKASDFALTFERGLSSFSSLTTVRLKLFNESNDAWARAVNIGLSASTQLKSVMLEFYGQPRNTTVQDLKLLLSNTSLISLSLIVHGNVKDCLASALSDGLSGETALESLTVIVHGSLSNLGSELLVKSVQGNRTLHSLTFKVFGDVPEHWIAVVDKIRLLATKKSWKTLILHPNVQGKIENAPISLLNPILTDTLLDKNLTINILGELSICNVETLGGCLQKGSTLSSLTLNVYSRVSNDVAECLVNFFTTNNVPLLLTINLWGEITNSGRTAFHRLRADCQVQSFILNVHGLVTEDSGCSSARNMRSTSPVLPEDVSNTTPGELIEILLRSKSLTELNLVVFDNIDANETSRHTVTDRLVESTLLSTTISSKTVLIHAEQRENWGYSLGYRLAGNSSLTTLSLTIHNHPFFGGYLGDDLGKGLAGNRTLTTFSLTVHNYTDTSKGWRLGLSKGLAGNSSLTTLSLTVHNHVVIGGDWGEDLGDGLALNRTLATFSLTVHDHASTKEGKNCRLQIRTGGNWRYGLRQGLAKNKSLTTFSLTVYTYTNTSEGWKYPLGHGLTVNSSLSTFSLTVDNHSVEGGDWGHSLGKGLVGSRSLTTFSLTVHNYSDMSEEWSLGLINGLAKNSSLTTFSLTVHNHGVTGGDWGRGLGDGLAGNRSLTTFSLTVHDHTSTKEGKNKGYDLRREQKSLAQGEFTGLLLPMERLQIGTGGDWRYGLGKGLAINKKLTTLSLTAYNYTYASEGWRFGLGVGLTENGSLSTFSLTVHNHGVTGEDWGHGLGEGLAGNRSLTTLSLTVHNYSDMSEGWSLSLSNGLGENSSLTTFSLTVHNHAVTRGGWGHNLGDGLAKNKSLKTLSLTVHDYTDMTEEWGHGLAEGLAKNVSLATLRLSFHNHSSKNRNLECDLLQRLVKIKSLTSLSLSVSLYGEDNVY